MSFNENLPKQLAELRVKWSDLRWKKTDMYHDCGCEYCEYDGLRDDYSEEDVEAIDKEMAEIEATFVKIKGYAKLHSIDVSDDKISAIEKEVRAERRKVAV